MLGASVIVALGILVATTYALVVPDPYRPCPTPPSTRLAGRTSSASSSPVYWRRWSCLPTCRLFGALCWIGLLAYVAYSYGIYVIGVPMDRVFLAYVVLEMAAGAALLGGPLCLSRWVVARRAGGTPYPVFVLDLVVVLPAMAAIGALLLRGHRLGGALAVVALVKILSLFAALWAGPAYAFVTDGPIALGPDAGPSPLLLAASPWLFKRWLGPLTPTNGTNEEG